MSVYIQAFTYQNLKVTSHSKVGDIAAHERDGTGNLTRLALHKTCVSVDVDITNESGPAGKEASLSRAITMANANIVI